MRKIGKRQQMVLDYIERQKKPISFSDVEFYFWDTPKNRYMYATPGTRPLHKTQVARQIEGLVIRGLIEWTPDHKLKFVKQPEKTEQISFL